MCWSCVPALSRRTPGRAQPRVIFVVVLGLLLISQAVAQALGAPENSALVVTMNTLGSLTVILLPGAISHGILRRRLIDLDLVVRKFVTYGAAFLLIAATYALSNRVPATLAVTVTIAAALAFQPLRRRLESAVSTRLFGERVRQYQLLKNLGTTMEQTAELDELLPRLAHAVRDGIGASWVQAWLRDADGSWLDDPVGVAGEVTGESAAGVDLARAGELVGRVDLGSPGRAAMPPMTLSSWPPWPRRPRQQSPTFGSRLSSRRTRTAVHLSGPPHCRAGTRSVVASSAIYTTGSSRRSWPSSPVCGSPATDSVVTSSLPLNSPICKIRPVRCFDLRNSPAASTRLCSATMGSSQRWSPG